MEEKYNENQKEQNIFLPKINSTRNLQINNSSSVSLIKLYLNIKINIIIRVEQ